jgi:hypothetical protein
MLSGKLKKKLEFTDIAFFLIFFLNSLYHISRYKQRRKELNKIKLYLNKYSSASVITHVNVTYTKKVIISLIIKIFLRDMPY